MLPMLKDFRARHSAALAWSGTTLTTAVALAICLRFVALEAVALFLLFIFLLAVAGLGALGADIRAAVRDTDSAGAALARAVGSFAILATGTILFVPCMMLVSIGMVWTTLVLNLSTYALIVDEAQRGLFIPNAERYQSAHGIHFLLGSTQPVQIAFPTDGHVEDGWGAIVYDPTGASDMAPAWGRNGHHIAANSIASTFGRGNCSPMIAGYYRCAFA